MVESLGAIAWRTLGRELKFGDKAYWGLGSSRIVFMEERRVVRVTQGRIIEVIAFGRVADCGSGN